MKPLTKCKYIAIWYIDCSEMDPSKIATHINTFKQTMSNGASNPWHELEVFLEAPVLGYFIPTRKSVTRLEIKKINFRIDYDE